MKEIQLSQGKVALVDDEEFEQLNKYKWTTTYNMNGNFYATRNEYNGKKVNRIKMHRHLLGLHDARILVDHIDGNGLNNQRKNLRIATKAQNAKNRRKKTGTSKYLGVYVYHQNYRTVSGSYSYIYYVASIKNESNKVYYKKFPYTPEGEILAAKWYDIKAKELHKEFANLNFK
jgi:hypothetical protein